jgi:L-malate glycosyltransferase
MTPVRLLYVTISMDLGGTERQLFELAVGLDQKRFSPHVCCLRGSGPFVEDLAKRTIPVTISRFAERDYSRMGKFALFCAQVHELSGLMRRIKPLIVHGMLPVACVTAGLAAKLAGVPVLVTGRRSLGCYKEGRFFLRQMENLVCLWTDAAVANSEAVREDALRREWIDPGRMRVIYNGVRFPATSTAVEWHELIGKRIEGPVVCLVANFFPYKGHMEFISAASIIAEKTPRVTFVLVGDGKLRAGIERKIAGLGMAEKVILIGARTDASGIMSLSDVVVLASHEEGCPNVILEAMAAGRPVVATRVGGVPEIVEDGKTGLLVPARDPVKLAEGIMRVLGDRREAEAMGRRGLELVRERFTIEKMVTAYEKLYESLMLKKESRCAGFNVSERGAHGIRP